MWDLAYLPCADIWIWARFSFETIQVFEHKDGGLRWSSHNSLKATDFIWGKERTIYLSHVI